VLHPGDGLSLSLDRPLRLGDRGEEVVALRRLVERVGRHPLGTASDVFDDRLLAAIRAFQQRRGLVADGVVGAQTLRALEGARWRFGDRALLLTSGILMRGDDVATLQERLVVLGLLAGPVDGVFGPLTDGALRELQRSLGVEADGVCGVSPGGGSGEGEEGSWDFQCHGRDLVIPAALYIDGLRWAGPLVCH